MTAVGHLVQQDGLRRLAVASPQLGQRTEDGDPCGSPADRVDPGHLVIAPGGPQPDRGIVLADEEPHLGEHRPVVTGLGRGRPEASLHPAAAQLRERRRDHARREDRAGQARQDREQQQQRIGHPRGDLRRYLPVPGVQGYLVALVAGLGRDQHGQVADQPQPQPRRHRLPTGGRCHLRRNTMITATAITTSTSAATPRRPRRATGLGWGAGGAGSPAGPCSAPHHEPPTVAP